MKLWHKLAAGLVPLVCLIFLTSCGEAVIPTPEHISAAVEQDCAVLVAWDAVDGADGYRIFRRESQSADYQYICDVEQSSYLDSGLAYGETYFYKVLL